MKEDQLLNNYKCKDYSNIMVKEISVAGLSL